MFVNMYCQKVRCFGPKNHPITELIHLRRWLQIEKLIQWQKYSARGPWGFRLRKSDIAILRQVLVVPHLDYW